MQASSGSLLPASLHPEVLGRAQSGCMSGRLLPMGISHSPSHSASLQAALTGHPPQRASWEVYLAFSRIPFKLPFRSLSSLSSPTQLAALPLYVHSGVHKYGQRGQR